MDFGLFFLVGFLGLLLLVCLLMALALRKKHRGFFKVALLLSGCVAIPFFAGLGWLVYIYGLNEPLATAASEGDIREVKFLLKLGASPNAEGVDGMTNALISASQNGHAEVVRLLLEKGADVRRHDDQGETALERAREGHYPEIVSMLERAASKK